MEVVHPPVRGDRHLEKGRQGLCPDCWRGPAQGSGDGDDLGIDVRADPGLARSSGR